MGNFGSGKKVTFANILVYTVTVQTGGVAMFKSEDDYDTCNYPQKNRP